MFQISLMFGRYGLPGLTSQDGISKQFHIISKCRPTAKVWTLHEICSAKWHGSRSVNITQHMMATVHG